jgi:hypothetical protein
VTKGSTYTEPHRTRGCGLGTYWTGTEAGTQTEAVVAETRTGTGTFTETGVYEERNRERG